MSPDVTSGRKGNIVIYYLLCIIRCMKKYIVSNSQILGGTPVISGTRVPIARILFLLKEGYTIEAIHDEFPHVPIKTIKGAVNELIENLGKSEYASKIPQV